MYDIAEGRRCAGYFGGTWLSFLSSGKDQDLGDSIGCAFARVKISHLVYIELLFQSSAYGLLCLWHASIASDLSSRAY